MRYRAKNKQKQWREYVKKRNKFIEDNPECAIKSPICTGRTQSVQHSIGRGIHLCDEKYWYPSCNLCNGWIETAQGKIYGYEHGFRKDRLGIKHE